MGVMSVARNVLSETTRQVYWTFRQPVQRLKKLVVRRVLESAPVNHIHNTVMRIVAGEILLAVIIAGVTAATSSSSSTDAAAVYNFVFPCVVSAACTETLRDPLNTLCDAYTQPLANRVQAVIARRWDDERFWLAMRSVVGVCVGAAVLALSHVNDPRATATFVSQTLATSFTVSVLKNTQHPVRVLCVACVACVARAACPRVRDAKPDVWIEQGALNKGRTIEDYWALNPAQVIFSRMDLAESDFTSDQTPGQTPSKTRNKTPSKTLRPTSAAHAHVPAFAPVFVAGCREHMETIRGNEARFQFAYAPDTPNTPDTPNLAGMPYLDAQTDPSTTPRT